MTAAPPASAIDALEMLTSAMRYLAAADPIQLKVRDPFCQWAGGCHQPASACEVHHLKHKGRGGESRSQFGLVTGPCR